MEIGFPFSSNIQQDQANENIMRGPNSSTLQEIHNELIEQDEKSSLIDLLLKGAGALEANNKDLASTICLRLNNILSGCQDMMVVDVQNPLDRLAIYFSQGLLHKCLNISPPHHQSLFEQDTAISTSQILLQEITPYLKFAHFTANQAILEASRGLQEVHVIDFDIMDGIQWPPLMIDHVASAKEDASSLRITAIVTGKRLMGCTRRTGKRLQEFADSINLHFIFDQVLITKEEDFKQIKLGCSEVVIANCMIHQLYIPQRREEGWNYYSKIWTFFDGMRKLPTKIIFVVVEEELFKFTTRVRANKCFLEFFNEALEHYSALHESILSSLGACKFATRDIEEEFLGERIMKTVKEFPSSEEWEKLQFLRNNCCHPFQGFRRKSVSCNNVAQAKLLISLFNVGYWVQHEQCRLILTWKSRPLVSASVWVPISRQRLSIGTIPLTNILGHS
ncbi:hypothetical protein Leryth_015675 [Lithospermum erythrorhizon]|nr:hypothetical protein Leryth_015675 [Lithospermum erythrorhizon]